MRKGGNWAHRYARWLEEAEESPLYDGRWEISVRTAFALPIWTVDFVRDWPCRHPGAVLRRRLARHPAPA